MFEEVERVGMTPGSDGGLLVGQTQLANDPSYVLPSLSPFDSPWGFCGIAGVHQSTSPVNILNDDGLGAVQLDFSGWGALWNNNVISLGEDSINFAIETGVGSVTSGVDCSYGDTFALDYAAQVTDGAFIGVYWGLHLEGTVYDVVAVVPVPAAVWLFGSGLVALVGLAGRRKLV